METSKAEESFEDQVREKGESYFLLSEDKTHRRTDQLFAYLMIAQWLAGIVLAFIVSPRTWSGIESTIHVHVWAAVFLGGAIAVFPVFLVYTRPGHPLTRHVIAGAQMLMSGLLVHLTGGRIETHFHVFGSLAILAIYRDWKLFLTATVAVGLDHLLRGIYFPISVYGVAYASLWRTVEHAWWVIFENVFLIWSCQVSRAEVREVAMKRAELEALNRTVENRVEERTQELFQAQEDLREREERMRTILYTAADAIITLDDHGQILTANSAAEILLGAHNEQLTRKSVYSLFEEPSRSTFEKVLSSFRTNGDMARSTSHCKLTFPRSSSEQLSLDVTLSSMTIRTRRMFTAIMRDVTERLAMELQLRQAQKLESIGQLAAGIAHEINTPIQFVGDNTRFLQDEFHGVLEFVDGCTKLVDAYGGDADVSKLADEVKQTGSRVDIAYLKEEIPKAIQQSLEGVSRVSDIVRAMKAFSHPGASHKQTVDLNASIESVVVVSTNEWKYVATVELNLDRTLPAVPCFLGELNQVILNLIVNSAHAIADVPDRGPTGKGCITISSKDLDEFVEIRVCDSGMGIPKENAHRIFDPFFTTKDVGKGTGQGLALARTIIVNKHGGTIHFESEVGKGTTFILRLPKRESAQVARTDGQRSDSVNDATQS